MKHFRVLAQRNQIRNQRPAQPQAVSVTTSGFSELEGLRYSMCCAINIADHGCVCESRAWKLNNWITIILYSLLFSSNYSLFIFNFSVIFIIHFSYVSFPFQIPFL